MTAPPLVSVIVPTHGDEDNLRACLKALCAQTLEASKYEVIVADNNRVALSGSGWPGGTRHVHEPGGYSYAARNAALKVARGSILAFTDADCLPEPEWLRAGAAAVETGPLALAGGRIDMFAARDTLSARCDRVFEFRQEMLILRAGYAVTANLFVRSEVFRRVGPFDATLESGGDLEFCARAVAAGFRIGYAAAAVVRHPARERAADLFRKNRRLARGYCQRELWREPLRASQVMRRLVRGFVPRTREWGRTLLGRGEAAGLPWHQRPGVVLMRILVQYHLAFQIVMGWLRRPTGRS